MQHEETLMKNAVVVSKQLLRRETVKPSDIFDGSVLGREEDWPADFRHKVTRK